MTYHYKTHGTCSSEIVLKLDGDTVKSIQVLGGCSGNLQGIASLTAGMKADEVVGRLKGIRCGSKSTSCPDQIALAILEAKKQQKQ